MNDTVSIFIAITGAASGLLGAVAMFLRRRPDNMTALSEAAARISDSATTQLQRMTADCYEKDLRIRRLERQLRRLGEIPVNGEDQLG